VVGEQWAEVRRRARGVGDRLQGGVGAGRCLEIVGGGGAAAIFAGAGRVDFDPVKDWICEQLRADPDSRPSGWPRSVSSGRSAWCESRPTAAGPATADHGRSQRLLDRPGVRLAGVPRFRASLDTAHRQGSSTASLISLHPIVLRAPPVERRFGDLQLPQHHSQTTPLVQQPFALTDCSGVCLSRFESTAI
jgi:hypothetical protein